MKFGFYVPLFYSYLSLCPSPVIFTIGSLDVSSAVSYMLDTSFYLDESLVLASSTSTKLDVAMTSWNMLKLHWSKLLKISSSSINRDETVECSTTL